MIGPNTLARMDCVRLARRVENKLLRAADLRQPRVRVVRVVVQPRDRAGRPEEDFSEGAVEPLVVLLSGNIVWNEIRPANVAAQLRVRHEWRPRVAVKRAVALL